MTDKLLALSIPGFKNPVGLPSQINTIVKGMTPYGGNIIGWAINMVFVLATILALLYMTYAGIKWSMTGGDPKAVEQANHMIVYGAVGLGFIFLSAFFVNVAAAFLCVPLLGWVPPSC